MRSKNFSAKWPQESPRRAIATVYSGASAERGELCRGQKPPARYEDPRFRLAFARIVTHYWRHKCWMDDVDLIGGALKLAAIPAVLVHGRLDVSGPPDVAWQLSRAWRDSQLVLLDAAGHGANEPGMTEILTSLRLRPTSHVAAWRKHYVHANCHLPREKQSFNAKGAQGCKGRKGHPDSFAAFAQPLRPLR